MSSVESLKTLSEQARQLAGDLFRNSTDSPAACTGFGDQSCLTREEERPLTRSEKSKGWGRRPFYAYDNEKMCAGCRAYWFQEMAAQQLHEMYCWAVRIEAEEQRKKRTLLTAEDVGPQDPWTKEGDS